MVEIQENYKDYDAPRCVLKSIKRFIRYTPKKYLAGLHLICLTNTDALNRKERRQKTLSRKKKVALNRCNGWYMQEWNKEPARIVLLVDNILDGCPRWLLKFNYFSDIELARTFFHELGHHIHKTQAPEHREREDVADKWKRLLSRKYFWIRYWYVMLILLVFRPLLNWMHKKAMQDMERYQNEQE